MAKTSPTQRSLKRLREEGYSAVVTERWNPFARIRQDLYGFIDILAVRDSQTVGVQTTTASNMAAREKKIREHANLPALLRAGWSIRVHGWKKLKSGRWELKERDVT